MALRHLNLRFRPGAKDGRFLTYRATYRLVFLTVLSFVLILSLLMYSIHIIALVSGFVCLVGALYREEWTIDKHKRVLTKRIGLLWPYAEQVIEADRIAEVVVSCDEKECHLTLTTDEGLSVVIESMTAKKSQRLAEIKNFLQAHFAGQK